MARALTLLHLTFVGPDKLPATVEFGTRLTVVYGASDTGKSFIVNAIDYMLGASKLKEINEAAGYTRILLGVSLADGRAVTISRAPGANKIDIYDGDVRVLTSQAPSDTLSVIHNGTSEQNISRYLLKAIGTDIPWIRTNAAGKRRTLSLRDLAHLSVINETRMADPRSPVLATGQHIKETAEKSVFRFLLTGQGEPEAPTGPSTVEKKVGKGKIDLLDQLIHEAQISLTIEANETDLQRQLLRLENSLAGAAEAVGRLVMQRNTMLERIRDIEARSRDNRNRAEEVQVLMARFGLLRQQYESDLARLQMVAEAGNLLGYFRTGTCVFCGADPDHQQPGHHLDETSQLQAAVLAETRKTNELHADLLTTIEDLEAQLTAFEADHTALRSAAIEMDRDLVGIDERLAPHQADTQELLAVRTQIHTELGIHAQIQRLQGVKETLSSETAAVPVAPAEGIAASDLVEFEQLIKGALLAWKVPGDNRVSYDQSTAEVSVDDRKRASRGKGMMSIIHAAFATALARYSEARNLPHPGFVVLDSPVLTYRQPEDPEGEVVLTPDVVEHFYRDLAATFPSQVIVIENKTPPADIAEHAQVYPFSVPGSQRAGFFPVHQPSRTDDQDRPGRT